MPPPSQKKALQRQKNIEVKGAHIHNLKNIDATIPHRTITVISGLSGSGKTSLAFDTIFADWEAKYLQTFDAYTRQLMGKSTKPPVDYIKGILPSVGLKQKSESPGPRARVGTTADIYPYLKLLYARIGTTYSPISGEKVKKDEPKDLIEYIKKKPLKSKLWILSKLTATEGRTTQDTLKIEQGKGYTRLIHKGESHMIDDLLNNPSSLSVADHDLYLVIDRLVINEELLKGNLDTRLTEAIKEAFFEGQGLCTLRVNTTEKTFSDRFEADGITFLRPTPQLFDPNNPHGACMQCSGYGRCVDIDPHKVIPNPNLSLSEGAIAPWQGIAMKRWQHEFIKEKKNFPINTPYKDLSKKEKKQLWEGDSNKANINAFFDFLIKKAAQKMHFRILHARYRGYTTCTHCHGTGLRKEVEYVKIGGKSLIDLLDMNITTLHAFFHNLSLNTYQKKIANILLKEIKNRTHYLIQVGLSYLTLKRKSNTLSGGEYQRIRLARALGSALIDTLYILDEPTVGLHPKDTNALIKVFKTLQENGNTVVIVEHDEHVMRAADQIIDIGPEAGSHGGQIVFQGNWKKLIKSTTKKSHTVQYLTGQKSIPIPKKRKKWEYAITFDGITVHNIQQQKVTLPLEAFTCLTGVSGAGKSTIIEKVIYPALQNYLDANPNYQRNFTHMKGNLERIARIELITQNALGKSSRSNPATYTKAYDSIRKLFAAQPTAKEREYTIGVFSFNIPGGRCETCVGEGTIKVEMQFTPDITVTCDNCQGKRFKQEVLDITFQGKNIEEVLNMTIDDNIAFFKNEKTITQRLQPLQDVGLGYLRLGQSSSTLSGGEAQRVKLSAYLRKEHHKLPTLFFFDEPTTGLHFHDIYKLIQAFQKLVAQGHTVVVIEHNLDLIKCADWIIDIGPEGGEKGGKVIFEGRPEAMIKLPKNYTAQYLQGTLRNV